MLSVTLHGVSGHAGTLPMARRHDALAGAAEIMVGTERLAQSMGAPAVATVGSIAARPGGFNQVPGEAAFTVDFRHPDDQVLASFDQALRELIRDVGRRRGLHARLGQVVDQPSIQFDGEICAALEASCVESGVRWRRMPSHAGHDAQVIGTICAAAMLFMPSQGGHSHRPDERTDGSAGQPTVGRDVVHAVETAFDRQRERGRGVGDVQDLDRTRAPAHRHREQELSLHQRFTSLDRQECTHERDGSISLTLTATCA